MFVLQDILEETLDDNRGRPVCAMRGWRGEEKSSATCRAATEGSGTGVRATPTFRSYSCTAAVVCSNSCIQTMFDSGHRCALSSSVYQIFESSTHREYLAQERAGHSVEGTSRNNGTKMPVASRLHPLKKAKQNNSLKLYFE